MAFDQTKFLARFLEEAREHCARLNSGLLEIERNSGDAETMNALFRAAHTIKGSSRMMKLLAVTEVAHKLEDVLDALRGGKIPFSRALSDTLFGGVDAITRMIEGIAAGDRIDEPPAAVCEELEKAARGELSPGETRVSPPVTEAPAPASPAPSAEAGSQPPVQTPQPAAEAGGRRAAAETIRVDAAKLDALIKLMGEIVSGQNRWRRTAGHIREAEQLAAKSAEALACLVRDEGAGGRGEGVLRGVRDLQAKLHRLGVGAREDFPAQEQLIGQLQEISLKMRMLPLATVFDTFPRTVRDTARGLGKEIDFVVEGGETELDKKIIEKIGDPLLHMIRNAIDHGIEEPAERLAAGKRERGTLRLAARYEGGSVTVTLQDDGRGISAGRVREKALQKRLVTDDALARMSETEVIDFIFHPGFSTSAIITDLSGRGVGMDVARKVIVDELKGAIQVETKEGQGCAFSIRLPLTLAMFRLLLVTAGSRVFALPATAVCEIVTVPRAELIEVVNRSAVRLREQIIPVEKLARVLGIADGGEREPDQALLIIVATGNEKLGLVVDALLTEEDMVVKPLPPHLANVRLVSGVAVGSGNGIINVLRVPALLRGARELKEGVGVKPAAVERREITILVVDDSVNTREIEKNILEAYGYAVVMAEDGMEAYEKAMERRYDAVITDVEMPRLDGFSLTERLRRDENYRDTPIIIVTSREKEEDKRRGIAVGANAYIVKGSFEQSNLLDTVQNLVG